MDARNTIMLTHIDTPLGMMIACAMTKGICLLDFMDSKNINSNLSKLEKAISVPVIEGDHLLFQSLKEQLASYFTGKLHHFDLPLVLTGTQFQKSVWTILRQIPYGETCSYRQQAVALGNPSAVRAVANANSLNKISVIIPCHRVIASNGTLSGYAGGLWRKEKLLELERIRK